MKKIYYNYNSVTSTCYDPCGFRKKEGTMIGSVMCKQCPFCKGFDSEEGWIKCEIPEYSINDYEKV